MSKRWLFTFLAVCALAACGLWPDRPPAALAVEPATATPGDAAELEPVNPEPLLLLRPREIPETPAPWFWGTESSPRVSSAANFEMPLSEVGSAVTVITAEDIADREATTVAEVLRDVPGLDVVASGGPGQLTTVFIRGAASERTLVMLDGVVLNNPLSPGRGADISKLNVDNVERIEIVRGPQSVVFGSGAMGGIINIITRQGSPSWAGSLRLEGGSHASAFSQAEASGTAAGVGLAVGASLENTQGFSAARRTPEGAAALPLPAMDDDGYRNLTLDLNLDAKPAENLSLKLTNRYLGGDNELDNYGGSFGDDPNHLMRFSQGVSSLRAQGVFWSGLWKPELFFGVNLMNWSTRNDPDADHPRAAETSDYHARNFEAAWRNPFQVSDENLFSCGVDYRRESGDFHYASQYAVWDESSGDFLTAAQNLDFPERAADLVGVFAEDLFRFENITAGAGLRYDTHDRFGGFLTYRITPTYHLAATRSRIKGTYGTAFNAPSLYQLYSVYGNPSLRPETSFGWDVGWEQEVLDERLTLSATYFQTDYREQIAFVTDPVTYAARYVNGGQAQSKGWETALDVSVFAPLHVRATYTRLTANELVPASASGPEPLLRRADYKATLSADLRAAGVRLHVEAIRVGPRWDATFDPVSYLPVRVRLAPYTLVNLAAAYAVAPAAEIYVRIHNLLDADYADVLGYTAERLAAFGGVQVTL